MHLLYVDESGDPGIVSNSSRHFILCGLLVHHADWHGVQTALHEMRKRLHQMHGLSLESELHASEFLGNSRDHLGLNQRQRIQSLLHALGCVQALGALTPVCAIVDKAGMETSPTLQAWVELTAGVAHHIGRANRHARCTADGLMIICDDLRPSPGSKWLKNALSRHPELEELLLDLPFGRESQDSHLLQLCDLLSFLTKQSIMPNRFFSTHAGKSLLRRYHRLWSERGLRYPTKE